MGRPFSSLVQWVRTGAVFIFNHHSYRHLNANGVIRRSGYPCPQRPARPYLPADVNEKRALRQPRPAASS